MSFREVVMSASGTDIVFVFPPAKESVGAFVSHLGAAYLRAALAKAGIQSSQYLTSRPGTVGDVVRNLVALRPRIVGFTAYDANLPLCLSIARDIKQEQPTIKIVFGGPSVTVAARELLARHDAIDLCMLSEAEETAPHVFGNLCNGIFPERDQAGVAFRSEGKVICTADPPLVGSRVPAMQAALDVIPSPYLSGVLQDGRAGLLTGRGCTHDCQYCCFAALGRKKVRLHSLERVLAELEFISAHQRRTRRQYVVPVHDDTFTLLPERAKTLCQRIIARRLKMPLSCVTRADTVDAELLQLMRSAGFVSIAFGLESAVPSLLRTMGKVRPPDWPDRDLSPERHFIEQVRQNVICAKKLGFTVGVSIILGLPGETPADGEFTLRFIESLPIDYYAHNFLSVFRGTPLWNKYAHAAHNGSVDEPGLLARTEYPYDVKRLRPRAGCVLENEVRSVRMEAADAISDCEASAVAGRGVHTVLIESPELTPVMAEWLHKVLAVGGVVVQLYPGLKRQKREELIQRDRRTLAAHLVPVGDYIQLLRKRTRPGHDDYVIASSKADLYRRHKPRMVCFTSSDGSSPILTWLRGLSPSCELCDASSAFLRSAALARFKRQVTAKPGCMQRMQVPPRLRHAGRWLKGTAGAACRSLTRLEVDAQGNIRCCRFGELLGKVGDEREHLARHLAKLVRAAEQRRGCHRCTRAECPRCPFPGVDEKTYCRTMVQCAPVLETLGWIWLYSRLPSTVVRQQELAGG